MIYIICSNFESTCCSVELLHVPECFSVTVWDKHFFVAPFQKAVGTLRFSMGNLIFFTLQFLFSHNFFYLFLGN